MTARQKPGTLERVVKYDQETITKAWDYLAAPTSDGEDDYVCFVLFCFLFFFRHFLAPPKGGQNAAIFGPTDFFSAVRACRGVHAKKKKTGFNSKNTKSSKKLSPTASNTVNGPCNHKDLYLWHRGSVCFCTVQHKKRVTKTV